MADEVMDSKLPGCKNVILSLFSTYDTKQMIPTDHIL